MVPKAIITGITGQTGSYLAELLLAKGYEVHGIVRRASSFNRSRIEHLRGNPEIYGKRLFLHYADLTDATTLRRIVVRVEAQEFYHLAGQSHVGLSFEIPESTCEETAGATLKILEIFRDMTAPPKFYHASSSEIFGSPTVTPQNEDTSYRPVTPYGCAKAFATNLCNVYRESHGMFVCNGITYNHESPRRGENFVTRKIVATAARIANGSGEILELGNLDSERDWGYAPEYAEAMWRMLQNPKAGDYVIATGVATSVRAFTEEVFNSVGKPITFEGSKEAEIGRSKHSREIVLRVNSRFFRPADPARLIGDSSKAFDTLQWRATTIGVQVANRLAVAAMAGQST